MTGTSAALDYRALLQMQKEQFNAGYGKLPSDIIDCPICRNKGYIMYTREFENGPENVMRRCRCMIERELGKSRDELNRCCDGATLDRFRADTDWQKEILQKAVAYTEHGDGKFFWIGGQIGCGKTHICTGICRELMKSRRVKVMFWSYELDRLKNFDECDYLDKVQKYLAPDVLYIDDFLKRRVQGGGISAADENIAYDIINGRYSAKKQTIISSELTLSAVMSVSQSVGSRIYERSMPDYCITIMSDTSKNYRLVGLRA